MGKGLQIVLLAVTFICSGIAGYFLEGILIKEKEVPVKTQTEVAVTPAKSTVPEITNVGEPVKVTDGLYSMKCVGYVESGDDIVFELAAESDFTEIVKTSYNGRFDAIPGVDGETYYVRVRNSHTGETSAYKSMAGFKKVTLYTKLSKDEMNTIMKRGLESLGQKYTSQRISPSHKLIVNNLKSGDIKPNSIKDVYNKINAEIWKDVEIVSSPTYDEQNRLKDLVITVTYPEE